jgi:hypothetical protein
MLFVCMDVCKPKSTLIQFYPQDIQYKIHVIALENSLRHMMQSLIKINAINVEAAHELKPYAALSMKLC